MQMLALFPSPQADPSLFDVGGITLVQRLARSASLAGATELVCVGASQEVMEHLRRDGELKCGVRRLEGAACWEDLFDQADQLRDEFVVLDATQVYTPSVVRQLMAQRSGDWGAVLTSEQGEWVGAKLYGRVLRKFQTAPPAQRTLELILAQAPISLGIDASPELMKVRTEGEARVAMGRLRRTLRKPLGRQHDGITAYLLNRPISLAISRVLMHLPVHPNHITTFGLLLSFVATYLLATGQMGQMVLGAALMQFISISDGIDGELARMKLLMSPFGAKFDSITDDITKFGLYVGLGIGSARLFGDPGYLTLMWAGVFMTLAMLAVLYYELIYKNDSGTLNAVTWWFEEEGVQPTLWQRFLVGVSFCLKRDTYTFGLTLVAALGFPHTSFVSMTVGIGVICVFTYGQRLVRFAKRPALAPEQETIEIGRAA